MRKPVLPGGGLEYRVLAAIWELGRGSARDLYLKVGEPSGLVYTTVAKVLDRLFAKGLVRREKVANAFVYTAAVRRDAIDRARAAHAIERLLGDDVRPDIAFLVDALDDVDPRLLDELARLIAARRRGHRGS